MKPDVLAKNCARKNPSSTVSCKLKHVSPQIPPSRSLWYRVSLIFLGALCGLAAPVSADQKVVIGDYEAHYVVFPSTFLNADIANNYNIRRAPDLSIVNLSIIDAAGNGTAATIAGQVKNLLGQLSALKFREIREDQALYYIAEVRHTHREVLRFAIAITPPGEATYNLKFQQELHWDE